MIVHPLARSSIKTELARLIGQKAAALRRRRPRSADHGRNGTGQEYGVSGLPVATRVGRIAPVSREMILNYVAMHSLGLPRSY